MRERDDFYETPAWATRLILPTLGGVTEKMVLDPFAGRGAILDVCQASGASSALAVEKDSERAMACGAPNRGVHCGDTFNLDVQLGDYDLIVTNVPFSRALEAVQWCIARGRPTAVLLRLAFLESAERLAFHQNHPADVHVLSRRPSFLTAEQKKRMHEEALERWRTDLAAWQVSRVGPEPKKPSPPGTDSAAYAWFVWNLGAGGKWSVLG